MKPRGVQDTSRAAEDQVSRGAILPSLRPPVCGLASGWRTCAGPSRRPGSYRGRANSAIPARGDPARRDRPGPEARRQLTPWWSLEFQGRLRIGVCAKTSASIRRLNSLIVPEVGRTRSGPGHSDRATLRDHVPMLSNPEPEDLRQRLADFVRYLKEHLTGDSDEIDGGHCIALSRPKALADRLHGFLS